MARILRLVLVVVAVPLVLLALVVVGINLPPGRALVADALAGMLSAPGRTLHIGQLDGSLPLTLEPRDISVSDAQGAWMQVDRLHLTWQPEALLGGTLAFGEIIATRLDVLRKPDIPAAKTSGKGMALGIDVQKLVLARIDLEPAVLGEPASLAVDGKVRLVDPSEGLVVDLAVRRTDGVEGEALAHLAYVPDSGRVTVSVRADEPHGGLAARALALPGLPPVHLEAMVRGTLDDLSGGLRFTAGDAAEATAQINMTREGDGRRFTLAAEGHGAALAPAAYRQAAQGEIKLDGGGRIGPDGIVRLDRLALSAPALSASAHGSADPNGHQTDLSFQAEVPGGSPLIGLLPALDGWDSVSLNGSVASAATGGQGAYAFHLEARAKGLALRDATFSTLVGSAPTLTADGTANVRAAHATFKALNVDLAGGKLGFTGTLDRRAAAGALTADGVDLATLGQIIGHPLAGTGQLSAQVNARLDGSAVTADIRRLNLTGLRTSLAQADAVLGTAPVLSGKVVRQGEVISLSDVKLSGAHADLAIAGTVGDRLDLTASGAVDDLGVLLPKLSGWANLRLAVTGTPEAPTAAMDVDVPKGAAFGREIEGVALAATAADLRHAPNARLRLNGKVAGQSVALSGTAGRAADGTWSMSQLAGNALGVRVSGSGRFGPDNRHEAAIHLDAPDLAPLGRLAGQGVHGTALLDLVLPSGSDAMQVRGTVTKLASADASVPKATIDGTVTGLFAGKPLFKGTIDGPGAAVKGTSLGTLKLTVTADASAAEIGVSATPRGIPLDGTARVAFGPPLSITVSRLRAGRGGEALALAGPLDVSQGADGSFRLSDLRIDAGSGSVRLDGTAGRTLDLQAKLERVPLALMALVAPALGAEGTLGGTISLSGPAAAPTGRFTLDANGVSTRQIRAAGVGGMRLAASGSLAGGNVRLDAKVDGASGLAATVAGTVALSKGSALDLAVKGRLQAGLVNPMLSGESRLTGTVNVDMRLTGTLAAPKLGGSAELADGTYNDPAVGVKLEGITARAVGTADTLTIGQFSAKIAKGGSLAGKGRVQLKPSAGFPGEVTLKFDHAAVNNGTMSAVFGGDLALSGPLARTPKVSGTVRISQANVEVANRLPGSARSLQVRHVNASPAVRAQAARLWKSQSPGKGPVFDAALDIKVVAENQIFVRGRGLNAELGGTLRLEGRSAAPQVVGAFDLRRGTFDVLGKRLDFTQSSKLIFDGTLDPQLDLEAESQTSDVTAKIVISGRASSPKIALTSEPQLPQDEIAARVLFGKSVDKLSGGQAATLALSVAELGGFGGGQGILDKVRRSFGLDQVDVTQDQNGGVAVGVSRYITKNISVGARQGTTQGSTKATVNVDITPHIRASAGAGADGSGDVGINMQWDY